MKPIPFTLLACTGFFAVTPHVGAVTAPLTGGDAGQGLSLDAVNFLKALDVGSATPRTVQTKVFDSAPNAGFSIAGVGNYGAVFTFGAGETSADDLALAEVVKTLAFAGGGFDVTINSLTPGGYYRIDLVQTVGTNFNSREQAILLGSVFQENVLLSQGNNARVTTISASANASGQIVVGLRPSGVYGGTGPQDGAVLSGIAVTSSTASAIDSDNDGLSDEWEIANFRNPNASPPESDAVILAKYTGTSDPDGDTFSNRDEFLSGSNPNDFNSVPADQDGDGMADAWEKLHFGSIAAQPFDDFDNDGSKNISEFTGSTAALSDWQTDASDPKNEHSQPDSDGNGIGDGWETVHYSSISIVNPTGNDDTDGLNNQAEYLALTNPFANDTDGDGLSDSAEVNRMVAGSPAATNPRKMDTDGDGLSDAVETNTGIYVNRSNTGSNPLLTNSDSDAFPDGEEVARGSDPNNGASTPPQFALIAQWRMNETVGQVVPSTTDSTLPGVLGSINGSPVTAAWQPGEGIGGALGFASMTDQVALPSLNLSYGFTVMGWIRPSADPQSAFARMITSQFQDGFFLGRDGENNAWKFIVNGNFGLAGGTITAGQWQHVAASYDGTTARLYVNGSEVGSLPMAPPAVPIQPVYFGSKSDPDRGFIGSIDEYKIYSGSLPAGNISTIYSQEQPMINAASPYSTWAQSFGINPSGPNGGPAEDFDGDGTRNEVERALGLNPTSGSSRFSVNTSGTPATGITLTWPSQPGINFVVRSGTSLVNFPTLEATVPAAANPATTTSWSTGPFAPGSTKFFRVEFTY